MKSSLRRKMWLCAVTMMGTMMLAPTSFVLAEDEVGTPGIETRTAKKEWVFKVIDGHLYKRLYNYSTGCFETDWILIE